MRCHVVAGLACCSRAAAPPRRLGAKSDWRYGERVSRPAVRAAADAEAFPAMRNTHPVELLLVVGLVLLEAVAVLTVAAVALVLALATCRGRRAAPAPPHVAPPARAAVAVPLAAIADELRRLRAAHLRDLAGTRRRCSKDRLIADLLALPI